MFQEGHDGAAFGWKQWLRVCEAVSGEGAVWGLARPGRETIGVPPDMHELCWSRSFPVGDWALSPSEGPLRQRRKLVRWRRRLALSAPGAKSGGRAPLASRDSDSLSGGSGLPLAPSGNDQYRRRSTVSALTDDDDTRSHSSGGCRLVCAWVWLCLVTVSARGGDVMPQLCGCAQRRTAVTTWIQWVHLEVMWMTLR